MAHRENVIAEKVAVAMLPAGDSRIELLEPTAADSPIANSSKSADRDCTTSHCACRTSTPPCRVSRLTGRRLLNEPRSGAGGHIYVFVHPASAGGVLLELIQESTN